MSAIQKIEVTRGVYWIDVPAADLRILCGCPADSVKHLMKRGLIIEVETERVKHETGPNAILLSDVLIQNGAFANLAEFPVLQMLYRQGTILPGHPNNTGTRPLLLGAESQVQAQMRYIYRGNYGLANEGELRAAGMSRARAAEEMRIKKKFAFDNIVSTEQLLDSLAVGSMFSEIRNGLRIRRTATNVFEFAYEDETVQVDLNLPKGVTYASPYPLSYIDVGRDYFSVVHSGDGDGWDVNRPAMSSIILFQGDVYLIDAGPNIQHSLTALGIGVNEIKGIFHTHAHDDHFCGLTTLMQSAKRIRHYASPPVRASVAKKWAALLSRPEQEFNNYFDTQDLIQGRWNNIEGLEVKPVFSPHPLETTIFFFRAKGEGGYRTYAHLADIASRRVLDKFLTEDPAASGISPHRYNKVWKEYLAKADVKKLDIGGGLIHGDAEDFRDDKSGKIILSHTARPLTASQKEIGSGATFGMVDTLIEGHQDFIRARAYHALRQYLPSAKPFELKMLLNGRMQHFNPETIVLKRGETHRNIHLIVTGVVEMLDSEKQLSNQLCEGALIGELSGFTGEPSRSTFRALTHVHALVLPRTLLNDVIRDNSLEAYFEELRTRREFLRSTWLFGGSLSASAQNHMASAMLTKTYCTGEMIAYGTAPAVYLMSTGTAKIRFGERLIETIGPGDFFGEGFVLFNIPCLTRAYAQEDATVSIILANVLRDIPVVRWKLFEAYRRRVEAIVGLTEKSRKNIFDWREEYSTGVPKQDEEHKELLKRANIVFKDLDNGNSAKLRASLDELIDYTAGHFSRELGWYAEDEFPEYKHHTRLHQNLLDEVSNKADRLMAGAENHDLEFVHFFKNWLIDHILTEDRKYGQHLMLRQG